MVSLARPLPNATISSGWMEGRIHHGLDFAASKGTPILAAASGHVTYAGFNQGSGYGTMVEIDHGSNITTRYAHMSGTAVSQGDKVDKGDKIGYVGSTGDSTGPHLHFEVIVHGSKVNPEQHLSGEPIKPPGVPDTGGPFDTISGLIDTVKNVVEFLTDPQKWYRLALFALGMVLLIGGVWYYASTVQNKPKPIRRRLPE